MDALKQRLKELDRDKFEDLCFHILTEKHPDLAPQHVDGSGGDEGLDVFSGELFGVLTIWQCKSFADGVGDVQKKQIRKSLKSALKHFRPSNWILCLSVDLDSKAHRWFEKWKRSNAAHVKIGLLSASDIVHELIHRRSIRSHFFPGAEIDPVELKRLVTGTGELSAQQLEAITENNLEDVIERMKETDARCNYQIVFDGDLGPPSRNRIPLPGLIASVSTGAKTVNVFARDVEALRSNPPTFKLSLTNAGVEKYKTLLRTGRAQEFFGDEFGPLASDWPILAPLAQFHRPGSKLVIDPSARFRSQKRSVRVIFRNRRGDSIEYALMQLSPTSMGREEAEFVCSGEDLPFKITVTLASRFFDRVNREVPISGDITLSEMKIAGSLVRQIKKFIDAQLLLQPFGEIEIFDLQEEKSIFTAGIEMGTNDHNHPDLRRLINDLAQINDHFNLNLRIPLKLSDEDLVSIVLLKSYTERGTMSANSVSMTLVKNEMNQISLPRDFSTGVQHLRVAHARHEPMPKLFGEVIDTGPCAEEFEGSIIDLPGTLDRFERAAIGEGVEVSFRPTKPVELSLLSDEEVGLLSTNC
jgi:hypothetical protein